MFFREDGRAGMFVVGEVGTIFTARLAGVSPPLQQESVTLLGSHAY